MGQRIHKVIANYLSFCNRHLALSLVVITILTSIAVIYASKLSLKSDLKELLPDNYRSVVELNRMIERIGGVAAS
jgi:predicted RND superfamily exporter protein